MNQDVLFKSLYGSKLYGTDNENSDTDWKAVYMPEWRKLLRGREIKNSVKSTGNDFSTNGADDEDFEMIPVQVFFRDFLSGQAYAIELAFNALQNPEDANPKFVQACRDLTRDYLTSNVKAMTGYALNQAQKYGIKGTRLNALMKFTATVKLHADNPNQKLGDNKEFFDSMNRLVEEEQHVTAVVYHGPLTRDPANLLDHGFAVLEKTFGHDITFADALMRLNKMMSKYGARAYKARADNGADWKAVSHAMRVVDQAIDILTKGEIVFPYPLAVFYRDIKEGKYKWEYVSEVLTERLEELERAKKTTTLRPHTPELVNQFYKWNDDMLSELYFLDVELDS